MRIMYLLFKNEQSFDNIWTKYDISDYTKTTIIIRLTSMSNSIFIFCSMINRSISDLNVKFQILDQLLSSDKIQCQTGSTGTYR